MGGARDCAPCQKWAKRDGFVAVSKTLAGLGHSKKICKDAYPGAGAVQETRDSVRHVRWSGRSFPENGCMWSIRSWGLLRWFCVTDAALRMIWPHFFAAGAILWTNGMEKSQNALVRGRQLCTQLSADLLRFWCCQLRKTEEVFKNSFVFSLLSSKIEKSRRIAAFLMLSSSKIENVSQNSFVFTLAGKQIDRQVQLQLQLPLLLQLHKKINILRYITLHWLHYTTLLALHYTSSTAQGGGGSFRIGNLEETLVVVNHEMAERIHWLTERWLELCLLEWLQWLQWSPYPQVLDVVWCTATVVVVVA